MAVELEGNENGEYETDVEKGGEVALEQLHITRLIIPEFNVRIGHQVLPVGSANAFHEPLFFFGTVCPENQTMLMPSTWHETGLSVFGTFGRGYGVFDYQAMIVAGLMPTVLTATRGLHPASRAFSRPITSHAGICGKTRLARRAGLRTGVSFYYCPNTGANSDKSQTYSSYGKIPVEIFSRDAEYSNRYLTARADLTYGHVGNKRRSQ